MSLLNRHRLWQLAVDGVLVLGAWYLAFWFRFANTKPPAATPHSLRVYQHNLHEYYVMRDSALPWVLVLSLVCFALFGFYNRWWRYVSTQDMWSLARGGTVACLVSDLFISLWHPVRGSSCLRSSRYWTGC